jgi:sugar lactone lactonase YvrE
MQRRFGAAQDPVEWQLLHTYRFADPVAAHFSPADELIYVGRFAGTMGLYRIDTEGSPTALWTGDNISGVVIDPSDGDVFAADGWSGEIFRTAFGQMGRTTWVAGFHSGDDDPNGMAIAPADYTGTVLAPGEALVVDRGYNGLDEVWWWSPTTAEGETVIHADNGTLINPVDIAIGTQHVYLVDTGDENGGPNPGAIYELHADGSLTQLATSEPLIEPVGIAVDPVTQDLFIADSAAGRLVNVDVDTGVVTNLFTGFTGLFWASVDVAPDGSRLIVTDHGGDEIQVFERTP